MKINEHIKELRKTAPRWVYMKKKVKKRLTERKVENLIKQGYIGFVYEIIFKDKNESFNPRYIGIKTFKSKHNGKWQSYIGSSTELPKRPSIVKVLKRRIIKFCRESELNKVGKKIT